MSILRAFAFCGAVIFGTVAATGTASAQTCYPNCTAAITISATVVPPGAELTVTATGLDAGTTATGTLNSTPVALGSKTVSANGSVFFTFKVPLDFTGQHSVTVQGISNGRPVTLSVSFRVVTAEAGGAVTRPGNTLARTGSDSAIPATSVGIALLGAGATAIYVSKRRRRAPAAA